MHTSTKPESVAGRLVIPQTMQAAVYHGKNDVRLETVPVSGIDAGELLVRDPSSGGARTARLIDAEVKRANGELTRVEQVKAFRLLPRELDPELEGEPVTPTRKVKRRVMAERYSELVESMYADDEERRIAAEVGTGR